MTTTIGQRAGALPSCATLTERLVLRATRALDRWVARRMERRGERLHRAANPSGILARETGDRRRVAQASFRIGPFQG